MIAVFIKELRENLKWAALIFAVLAVLAYDQVRRGEPFLMFQLAQRLTVFYAPLAGLLMGLVQSLFETRPDNWAFVVHRPLPRGRVFAAKGAAGLLLLYAALELPCLLAAAWAARPGNLAVPFQARMLLPTLADTLNAGCFYFAGMVLALRRARWHGTRLLPIGLPLLCTAMIGRLLPEFWQALVVILAVQCVGALAAWGAFSTAGAMDAGRAGQLGLAAMIYPGGLAVGLFLAGLSQLASTPAMTQWHTYELDPAGKLLRVTRTHSPDQQRSSIITDLEGHPLPEYAGIDPDDPAQASRFVRFRTILVDDHAIPCPLSTLLFGGGYRSASGGVVRLPQVGPGSAYLYDAQRRVIDDYDSLARLRRARLGPDGYQEASPAAPTDAEKTGRFPEGLLNPHQQHSTRAMAFPSVVFWIDLHARRIQPVFTARPDDPVFSAVELSQAGAPRILVGTRRELHLLSLEGRTLFTVPLESDPKRHYFQPAILPANQHLVIFTGSAPGITPVQSQYREFAPDGRLVRRIVPPRLPLEENSGKKRQMWIFGATYPLAAVLLVPAWIPDQIFDLRCQQHAPLFRRLVIASAFACVAASLLLARRYGLGTVPTAGWTVINLLAGPAGVVAMIALNTFPVRERCASCGRMRLLNRRTCPACQAPLPAPSFDGREIFEPLESVHVCAG